MPFGFSLGELVATAGVLGVAFGPRDITKLARSLGKLTGHATGYINLMNLRAERLASRMHVLGLHRDMKRSIRELAGVTGEIKSGLKPTVLNKSHKLGPAVLRSHVRGEMRIAPVLTHLQRVPCAYLHDTSSSASPISQISSGHLGKFQHNPTSQTQLPDFSFNIVQQQQDVTARGVDILVGCIDNS